MNLQRPDIVLDFTVLANNDWLKVLIDNYCNQPSCETANIAVSIEHSAELPIVQNARLFYIIKPNYTRESTDQPYLKWFKQFIEGFSSSGLSV